MGLYTKKVNELLGFEEKEKNIFYGNYNGYDVTLAIYDTITVFVNFRADDEVKQVASKIFHTTSNDKMIQTTVDPYGFHSIVNGMTFNSTLKKVVEKLDATIKYLKEHEISGNNCCAVCGNEGEDLKTVRLNDRYMTLDQECLDKIEAEVNEADKEFEEKPNNYLQGILGALLGAFIGAVAWVLVYLIGFVSALTAVLAVFLGNYFYVKFGGKANKAKTVIVAVISLVFLVSACFILYIIAANAAIIEGNLNTTALEFIFSNGELKGAFIYDMVLNVVFTAIGVIGQAVYTSKKEQDSRIKISK